MKTLLSAVAVSLAVSSAAAYQSQQPTQPNPSSQTPSSQTPTTQTPTTQTPSTQTPSSSTGQTAGQTSSTRNDVTVTGCLVQGSGPNVFVIKDAKKDAKSTSEKGVSYVVVASGENTNLRTHLNHQVTVSGESDGRVAPSSTERSTESELPKLTAKNVTMISSTCSTIDQR